MHPRCLASHLRMGNCPHVALFPGAMKELRKKYPFFQKQRKTKEFDKIQTFKLIQINSDHHRGNHETLGPLGFFDVQGLQREEAPRSQEKRPKSSSLDQPEAKTNGQSPKEVLVHRKNCRIGYLTPNQAIFRLLFGFILLATPALSYSTTYHTPALLPLSNFPTSVDGLFASNSHYYVISGIFLTDSCLKVLLSLIFNRRQYQAIFNRTCA